jgi:ribosomal protein S18 acetylase RimI-like enzyme
VLLAVVSIRAVIGVQEASPWRDPGAAGSVTAVSDIGRLGEDDWAELREVRLAALSESPQAFASTLDRERGYDEGQWRSFVGAGAWFVARDAGRVVGVVAILPERDRRGGRHLVSMWVVPELRGRGVADALLGEALGFAAADGAEAVHLWVADGNSRARRFYERAGFASTGQRQPLPSAPEVAEELLTLRLTG